MSEQYGGHSMIAPLRRVLVRTPAPPAGAGDAARFNYPRQPDHEAAVREHEAFVQTLQQLGVDVIVADPPEAGELDSIFVYDPSFTTDGGLLLCWPGKEPRRPEVELARLAAKALDMPVIGEIEAPGTVEGGDTLWLDRDTLLVGLGYRTNAAGVEQLAGAFPDAEVIAFDLPHWNGEAEVMHLMSLISPLDRDLALVYLRLAPVRLVELLRERGIEIVEVPDEEFETMGANVLALGPRRALALEGNDETRRRLEAAGVDVVTYRGDEISRKGDGGPTCLTRPLLRG
jgi:N-dimethylarginine dimethylaminohydrolase